MKYIVILGDGMADRPVSVLGDKTPLQAAAKPHMDWLAQNGTVGIANTLREGMPLGSDVANLSVLGYKPELYYTGRSPIEALGLGLDVHDDDMVFRLNLVTIKPAEKFEDSIMLDHSSDKISSEDAKVLLDALRRELGSEKKRIFAGASYRNILIWRGVKNDLELAAPHDILNCRISDHLPKGSSAGEIVEMMKKSFEILSKHPLNQKREQRGLKPANCIWLWGEGTKPRLDDFEKRYGLCGAVITAVPLLQGLGAGMGMEIVEVEGATADINTNFEGKAEAALEQLKKGKDFVFVHIEAPDECGHDGNAEEKKKSIEYIDRRLLAIILKGLAEIGEDYRLLLMPDHATPICCRTHTVDPVPFVIYDSTKKGEYPTKTYDEFEAMKTGLVFEKGYELMQYFISAKK